MPLFGIVKEFLPDLGRALAHKRKKPATGSGGPKDGGFVPIDRYGDCADYQHELRLKPE